MIPDEREYGPQPLDSLMNERDMPNHTLVAASTEQLTHKMVSKARRGRFLSVQVRLKILRAWNKATQQNATLKDLFSY
ncbi:MAG: hypothetical protein IJJ26_12555 [Victivallales bacterium]|nr:hypothetical protein [Victivallales bacterium]